jgi:hypothetical protein
MLTPKVRIVILPVNDPILDRNGKKLVYSYENAVFDTIEDAREIFGELCGICELHDFIEMCNDQEIDIEEHWIGYITINN